MTRFACLVSALLGLLCGAAAGVDAAEAAKWLTLGPMVGHVTDSDARIWVQASAPARVSVRIGENAELARSRTVSGPDLSADQNFSGQVLIPDLHAGHRYFYSVLLDGRPVGLPPYPSFSTPPASGTPHPLRFAFFSCSGYQPEDPAAGWAELGMRAPVDLILMLGDNHYGNSPELATQRKAYLGQRRSPAFRELTSRVPLYGIWDDHDFGPNDSDGSLPGKETALRAFKEHWANPSFGEPGSPGVYFKFTRGDIEFFMLDGRYNRSPNKETNNPAKTQLGTLQLEWLKRSLAESKARVKILASGGEWQDNGTPDSWTSFPRERDDILGFIESKGIQGVMLLSGDRHFTAGYQVRGRFLEVSSGPFGASPAESRLVPGMFLYHGKGHYYCVYEVDTTPPEPLVTLEVYQVGMGLVNRRSFTWAEVTGRTRIAPLTSLTPPPPPKR